MVLIIAVLVGFVIQLARSGSGWPYDLLGAIDGVSYLIAVGYLRLRR
jgi:hypothetical protein